MESPLLIFPCKIPCQLDEVEVIWANCRPFICLVPCMHDYNYCPYARNILLYVCIEMDFCKKKRKRNDRDKSGDRAPIATFLYTTSKRNKLFRSWLLARCVFYDQLNNVNEHKTVMYHVCHRAFNHTNLTTTWQDV
jgi:hypothetical protein